MCDISGISDADMNWEGHIDTKEEFTAELCGQKRKIAILSEDTVLTTLIYKTEQHEYTLQNHSLSCKSLNLAKISPLEAGGSGNVHLNFEWGDKDGNKISGGISGEVHDDKGNYAKIEVNQDSDGKGSAKISAGHKEENDRK